MPLVVRTWNVFHGNAQPPERRAFLEEMVRLATADRPDVLCLQEVPLWALSRLERWSGMQCFADVAARARLGPLRELGRVLTDLHHGLLRSLLTGQANAILVARRLRVLLHDRIVLNPRVFREAQRDVLQLDASSVRAWAQNRRICQAVRIELPERAAVFVANLHATRVPDVEEISDAELERAAGWIDGLARPAEPTILCGDFNIRATRSDAMRRLQAEGYSEPGDGIDHILVRGAPTSRPFVWPDERRRLDRRLLSDHPPVEVTVG